MQPLVSRNHKTRIRIQICAWIIIYFKS